MRKIIKKSIFSFTIIIFLFISTSTITSIGNTSINSQSNVNIIEKATFSENRLDFILETLMKITHRPALSACIVKDNEIVWSKGYGYYDIENKKETTENTIFYIYSITKTITATAVMQLYEQEYFELDDNVEDFLSFNFKNPNYPNTNITFKMLLSHHSSLCGHSINETVVYGDQRPLSEWVNSFLNPDGDNYSQDIWTGDFGPGEKIMYSNAAYSLLAYIVEILTEKTFYQYCKEKIFIPLEMYNTSFQISDLNQDNIAIQYGSIFDGLFDINKPLVKEIRSPYKMKYGIYIPYKHFTIWDYASGFLRSTVIDMSHFLMAYTNGGVYKESQILNQSTIEMMHTVQYDDPIREGGHYFGLGWKIDKDDLGNNKYVWHDGYFYGGVTKMDIRVSDNTSVVFFMNRRTEAKSVIDVIFYNIIRNILFKEADLL